MAYISPRTRVHQGLYIGTMVVSPRVRFFVRDYPPIIFSFIPHPKASVAMDNYGVTFLLPSSTATYFFFTRAGIPFGAK